MKNPISTARNDGSEIIVYGGYFDSDDQSHGMKNNDENGFVVINTRSGKFVIPHENAEIVKPLYWSEISERAE